VSHLPLIHCLPLVIFHSLISTLSRQAAKNMMGLL
jgi:hypothetical protein